MPTYLYECKDCNESFSAIHSIKVRQGSCSLCSSNNIERLISPFAAKTETSQEAQMRRVQDQCIQDRERFLKDDKFAANITGADDSKSDARKLKVAADNIKYIESKREQLTKEGKLPKNQIRRKEAGK